MNYICTNASQDPTSKKSFLTNLEHKCLTTHKLAQITKVRELLFKTENKKLWEI